MKIRTEVVQKLVITDVPSLDPVAVYLENMNEGYGKLTITCFNDCWSYGWGAMGSNSLRTFLLTCDTHYLAGKLGNGLSSKIDDPDNIYEEAKKEICERRKQDDLTKKKARELFDEASCLQNVELNTMSDDCRDAMYEIFGDEWYDCLPQKPNPKWEYLCRVIEVVKEALKEEVK